MNNYNSIDYTLPFELIIEHGESVPMTVLGAALSMLDEAAHEANIRFCRLLPDLIPPMTGDIVGRALAAVEENRGYLVWLDGVEPGSSKFKGAIVNVGKWTALLLATSIVGDVVKEKDWYDNLIKALDQGSDKFAELVVDDLRKAAHPPRLPDGREIEFQIVADRLRIVVHPPREGEVKRFQAPPPPNK